jgi:hypothetical protein
MYDATEVSLQENMNKNVLFEPCREIKIKKMSL